MANLVQTQRKMDRGVALVTYTIHHQLSDPLVKTRDIVSNAHKRMHSGKGWQTLARQAGWIGSVRAVEPTFGDNGWHYHLHELCVTDHPEADYSGFAERWQKQVRLQGGDCDLDIGLKITEATGDLAEYTGKWGIVPELVLGAYKRGRKKGMPPFQLLDMFFEKDNKRPWADLFYEYYEATKGVRQLCPSPNFRGFMRQNEDPTPDDTSEPLALLDSDQWYSIWHEGLRGPLLNSYADGYESLQSFLIEHVSGYGK